MVQDLYILMITAAVVSIVFKLLKQPVVLGYIVAGVLVGPYLYGKSLVNPDNVKQWGDIGVLFVLFCIGLEFRLKNLISSGKVAASVTTTFLTPYIMKAAGPCYTFLYNHVPASMRAEIDKREQLLAEAEAKARDAAMANEKKTFAGRVRHAVRNTYITKHLVDLFIKNMSAHDDKKQR